MSAPVPSPLSVRGFLLQPLARVEQGVFRVRLYGTLESGEPFCVEDDRFQPYAFVRTSDWPHLRGANDIEAQSIELRTLANEPVLRVEARAPHALAELRSAAERAGRPLFEADLRPAYRYLIDRGVLATFEIRGPGARDARGLWRFLNPELVPAELMPSLRVLSLDIETSGDGRRLYSLALVGAGLDEVHLVARDPVPGAVVYADEAALLRAFLRRIEEADPDVITGWNVVDFDLRVLASRCQALRIPFVLGRDTEPSRFLRDESFSRQSRVELTGRQILDGLGLVRDAFIALDDYRLETAAQMLLGRGKRIDTRARDSVAEIARMYREDPAALVEYNREDARLVLDILQQEALIDLAVERSRATGMQLDRVGASIASFDRLYLPELRKRGYVAPCVDLERKQAPVQGGAVLESTPGLFRNVAVFDFRSLYPSLMRTFNLDPLAHARATDDPDPIVAPNGARLAREPGILPRALEQLAARRAAAKQSGRGHADLAIKILMNACFGVLAARSCRFFDAELANAITWFGQQTLAWTREAFEAEGVRVLYGDTDSIFVALAADADREQALAHADTLRAAVQARIAERVHSVYAVDPVLELELDKLYDRYFQPSLRTSAQGSKKRYAGLVGSRVEVVGLEAVRRDWPRVVRRLQLGMLERWFHDLPVPPFVRELVAEVLAGACDEELVVRKGLRKGSVERYAGRTPPHVAAARRAGLQHAREIRYVVTRNGPEPVIPGRPFPEAIDYEHYVQRMLRPVADAILSHQGESFDHVLGKPRQLVLL